MTPFISHRGLVVTLDRANIDTDQIMAKQFLKLVSKTGFGQHLFHDWRTLPDGRPNPDFPLNFPRFRGASILVTRNNFGCGSSREHAVWGIVQYGFKVVIAPSKEQGSEKIPAFADIFKNNSFKNALLLVELPEKDVERIFQAVAAQPGLQATVDLARQTVRVHTPDEFALSFEIDPAKRTR
jgi:3-isopropylmalate/(R)-2-methylmalate dehydratase small subunit